MLADRAGMAAAHDVTGVAGVAFAEDHLAAGEAARDHNLRDAVEIFISKRLKDGHGLKQCERLLTHRWGGYLCEPEKAWVVADHASNPKPLELLYLLRVVDGPDVQLAASATDRPR